MKVIHLSPTFFHPDSVVGGGERYVDNVARASSAAAYERGQAMEQKLVTLGRRAEDVAWAWGRRQVLVNEAEHPDAMRGRSGQIRAALAGADIVHLHQPLTDFGAEALVVAKSLRLPVVATDLGGGTNEVMLQGGGLELADAVLSISRFARATIGPHYHGLHEVVIGPVDTAYFSPGGAVQSPPRPVTVLCVGRLLPHKGVDQIIKALPTGMRLQVVGQAYHAKYLAVLKSLAAGKDVTFISDASDAELLGYYRSADVLVQASTHLDCFGNYLPKPELMGLTTLEALACGLPVIVSTAGSLPELATDVDFSLVFKHVEDLRAKLVAVRDSAWPLARCPERMHAHVAAQHGILRCGGAFLDLYAKVIARCAA
jgi:glycosyltransferase involved in cell wall biosynthesis